MLKKYHQIITQSYPQVGMLCFMMWMSGSGVQIFSIMMTFTGLWQPLKARGVDWVMIGLMIGV